MHGRTGQGGVIGLRNGVEREGWETRTGCIDIPLGINRPHDRS